MTAARPAPGTRSPPIRVVSLVPSATETLVALGVVPVGVTRYCELAGSTAVGGTKNPDVDAVIGLAPDLVVVNDEENRREDAVLLEDAGLAVHSMSPRSVDDVGQEVRALAVRLGVDVPPAFEAARWQEWMAAVQQPRGQRAFVAIWRRPWMSIAQDTYGGSLLELIGVGNIFGAAAGRYPEVTLEDVAVRTPDVVLLPSEPYPFQARHVREVEGELPGVRVVLVDGRDLFWWGIRTPIAASRLLEAVSRR